ncbi:MAG: hypothetical protein IPP38_10940 [Bacteroidetes bacterium]|nr:hypothetical protein [Bacteroidota bacterium]
MPCGCVALAIHPAKFRNGQVEEEPLRLFRCGGEYFKRGGAGLVYRTKQATPANARLIDRFVQREKGQAYAKSLYLLRDTLKVTGSAEQGLAPASLGIFYVDRSREGGRGGGTGHTLRVCEQAGVPVILQEEWMQWLREIVQ